MSSNPNPKPCRKPEPPTPLTSLTAFFGSGVWSFMLWCVHIESNYFLEKMTWADINTKTAMRSYTVRWHVVRGMTLILVCLKP